jgi:hypothetical protein
MRILLKCPTRSRPDKILSTLQKYVTLASDRSTLGVAISCDDDDTGMRQPSIQTKLHTLLAQVAWHQIFFGPNKSKIEACNANMGEIDWAWDIVVLVSDDMIPQMPGWDAVIRTHMKAYFPTTDGILWWNDGYQGEKLNTLCIYGRTMYESLGCIYRPEYKSFYCDTELTDRCLTDLAPKCKYVPYCIIRHEHPGTGFAQNMDTLYAKNQGYWSADLYTYVQRKAYPVQWSVLIPTMAGREQGLLRLLESIHEKAKRLAPELTYEICLAFDNRESSVGVKRQGLLQGAKGKYMSFIDDDDEITDAYIEDLWAMIQGEHHTMRLRGQMSEYQFVHSTEITLSSYAATQDEPPLFQRPPNHLNPMLTDIAKLCTFKDARRGEDLDWAMSLYRTGSLKTEYRSDPSRIHYIYHAGNRLPGPAIVRRQRDMTYETLLGLVWIPGAIPEPPPPPPQSSPRVLRLGPKGFVSK